MNYLKGNVVGNDSLLMGRSIALNLMILSCALYKYTHVVEYFAPYPVKVGWYSIQPSALRFSSSSIT